MVAMAEIVAFRAPRLGEPTVAELTEQVGVLAQLVIELACQGDELRRRLAEIETRVPKPRFTIPPAWVNVKNAAALCGYAAPTVSEWARARKIVSIKIGGRRYIDPGSLPPKAST